jgi:hypothetical protein
VRHQLAALAQHADEWAGIPMDLEGERLVVERSYKFASVFDRKPEPDDGLRVVNRWWSRRYRSTILIGRNENGRAVYGLDAHKPVDYQLSTMGCSAAWGIEQEHRALELLGTMLRHHMFKAYLLSGMFIESSPRSGVVYLFRKLRPTVALKASRRGHMRTLAAMCMHPIGYYASSWAGAMCPTDDVIAHLALMRGDEHMFWRRCNQHGPHSPEAGI